MMNKIIVPTGGEYNLILSDGTRVYLNAESVITFPKHFTGREARGYFGGRGLFSRDGFERTSVYRENERHGCYGDRDGI